MASTSIGAAAASSSHTAAVPMKKHEVFISFRGEDTRHNFTSHLYTALLERNIETYIDYRIEKGDEVWPVLIQAIHDSSVFLVILSENYASSTWCLNELVEIMECKENGEDVHVIPVFYKVEPSHVRKQTGSYKTAFDKHDLDFGHSNKTQKWKETLTKVANISGFDSNSCEYRSESDMIGGIIELVLQKLNCKHSYELRDHFIPDDNFSEIKSLLSIESKEVRIIGMWGMGGIGKTTIAEAIFCEIASQYDGACFFANIREKSKGNGLNYIYNRVLSELLEDDIHIDTSNAIPSFIVNRLRSKKVLIVLDDVNSLEVITKLVGVRHDSLGARSVVIVTTRDKHVLKRGVVNIHEVKKMNFQNSIQLFSLNAFDKTHPEKRFEELSKRAVNYAKGIPLALKVLGSFLCSKSENEWENALKKLNKYPNSEIQGVLKLSYDELDVTERKIFLDIACFLEGQHRDTISSVLNACDFYADIGIRSLLNKALITISLGNYIQMHDLIREMGHEIVRCESPDNPAQCSKLWDTREVCDVLTNNKGTNTVESIFLDMSQITDLYVSSRAFRKMQNLRLLAFINSGCRSNNDVTVSISRGFEMPRSLRFLQWDKYPLKSLPSISFMENLVVLSMQESNVEKLWNGVQNFPRLKEIDLSLSRRLRECPNLSGAPNLETLYLKYCDSLQHVDPSVFSLPKLQTLEVVGCKELRRLCSNSCSPSLRILNASRCTNLQEFSVTLLADQCNIQLKFSMSGLKKVPSSILHLRNIEKFYFPICESLCNLPENSALDDIYLSDPTDHECDVWMMLHIVFPSPIFWNVRILGIYVSTLFDLPHNIELLSSLEKLSLEGSGVVSLPESMKHLPRLKFLNVNECKMLRSVPALPQSIQLFLAHDCISLKTLLNSKIEPPFKKSSCTLLLTNCISLDEYAFDNIMDDAINRIDHWAKLLSAVTLEHAYSKDDDDDILNFYLPHAKAMNGKISYFLPATSLGFGECFHYSSTQASFTIQLPPNFKWMGFVFYCVVPRLYYCLESESVGCECYLEKCKGEMVEVKSFFMSKFLWCCHPVRSDHMCLWYDAQCCKQIMEAIKEATAVNDRSTTYNPKLTFKFSVYKIELKECGVSWIYPSEDQIVDKGSKCQSKKSTEIYELGDSAFQNGVEGPEPNQQDELVPLTNSFMQHGFETSPSSSTKDTEDLRLSVEELLHIGFGIGLT